MNDINKIFFENCCDVFISASNSLFMTDLFFNNKISDSYYLHRMDNCFGHPAYPFDFYLCMLCAGITEDMIFSPSEKNAGNYNSIESIIDTYELYAGEETWFDPCIAVYSGRYGLAERLMDITEYYIYDRLTEAKCWDFIDKITDCGKGKRHIELMTDLLVRDYLRGGNSFFDYITRYGKNELLTCGEAIDKALLEINSADSLFEEISFEVIDILNGEIPDVDRKKFNERAIGLMQRCAQLGLTLKEFRSFNEMLLPVYKKEKILGEFHIFRKRIYCPEDMAKLIDENTAVYGGYSINKDIAVKNSSDYRVSDNDYSDIECVGNYYYFPLCCLAAKAKNNITEIFDEFEYICMDFIKRFGRRLVIRIESENDFLRIQSVPRDLFDICLCDSILEDFYEEINILKRVLNQGILSQKNIDEITAYFASKINEPNGNKSSFALKRLSQLNNKLSKMGGKIE